MQIGLISQWESVNPVPPHPASGLVLFALRAVALYRLIYKLIYMLIYSGWFPAGFLLSISPNLTDQQVGGDTPRECFSCSSVGNRLKEIHVVLKPM